MCPSFLSCQFYKNYHTDNYLQILNVLENKELIVSKYFFNHIENTYTKHTFKQILALTKRRKEGLQNTRL